MDALGKRNHWERQRQEPQRKKKKGRKVGIFRGRKPNGRGEEGEPLGDMCEGAPTEEEKRKKSWDIWGQETQWKHWEKETITGKKKLLGETDAGAPTEEEKGKKSWDI